MSAPHTIITVHHPEEAARWQAPELGKFDVASLAAHRVDAHLIALRPDGEPVARASVWWNAPPPLDGHTAGCIGHFAARDEGSAKAVLDAACTVLATKGCSIALGPMDGSTWRRYRFITERGSEQPFLLEPDNEDAWPAYWRTAGFEVLASFVSALNSELGREDPRIAKASARLRQSGIEIRALDMDRFESDLRQIHALSLKAFAGNFLFTPLPEREFMSQYESLRSKIRPELVLLAVKDGQAAGYVFCVPDWLRGPQTDTVVLKTLAVLPERTCAGLGTWLLSEAQIAARDLGYRRVIHALMHETNNSINISARYAEPFRRYALFHRPL